jgi:ribosomal protein L7/L12
LTSSLLSCISVKPRSKSFLKCTNYTSSRNVSLFQFSSLRQKNFQLVCFLSTSSYVYQENTSSTSDEVTDKNPKQAKQPSRTTASSTSQTSEEAPKTANPPKSPNAIDWIMPGLPGHEKISPKIEQLASEVINLNMVEMVSFLKVVATKIGVPFEQIMSMGSVVSGTAASHSHAEASVEGAASSTAKKEQIPKEPPKVEKTTFTVKLMKVGEGNKYKVLKEVRLLKPGQSMSESKQLVEVLPSILAEGVSKEEAQKIDEKIKASGGECAID